LASETSGRRSSGRTLVASTTVIFPAARRLPAMKCSTSNASPVAAWSFPLSDTRPRQKSEEMTSVWRKCRAANVDLPDPEGPISTTRERLGMDNFTW
jgi:hypothetical protein